VSEAVVSGCGSAKTLDPREHSPGRTKQVPEGKEVVIALRAPANTSKEHPFIVKLNRSVRLDKDDLAALIGLLDRKIAVKKGKDIIVEGYEYNALHIVESGFAIRYKLLQNGARQIVNIVLPGDVIGFPACFFERAVFSVMAITNMNAHHISLEAFADLCQ
jgi:CRP-like cAMP-binding protein